MFRSKKGLLSNLNHICLQHVSLGVHLSLRPEVQEGPITRAPPEEEEQTTACQLCQEEATLEVDANSNNASTLCLCCESHTHQLLKNGIQNEETNLEEVLDDHREEAGSPLEHALSTLSVSSSISSCSDYTLEETPVSFYCREFLSDGIPSPDSQPDIVPLEDSPVNANWAISEENQTNHKSEERCDISSYLQAAQLPFITPEEKTENIGHRNSSTNQHGVLLECPPCTSNKENVDSNCNSLEDHQEQQALHHSEQLDTNFNKVAKPMSTAETNAPSLPPKTAASLQALRDECVKTTLEDLFGGSSLPIALEQTELRRAEESKKNITSFHELAQRRKRGTAVPPPQWMSKDRSDWLITFSPDTELPPVNELTASVLYHYDKAHAPLPPLPLEMPNALELSHKGVTTFREMRFRNSMNKQGAQQGKGTCQPPKDEKPADKWSSEKLEQTEQQVDTSLGSQFVGAPHGGLVPQPRGHVLGHPVPPPRRKKCRQGLQPIAESHLGGSDVPVEGGVQQKAELPAAPGADPWSRGKADGGDRHSKEGDQPVRYSPECTAPSPTDSLENVEFQARVLMAPGFHPPLKALSCDEVCLVARSLAYVSPDELLPIRLSPVGAYSPPYRGVLPLLENPGLSVLLSPLFPRSRTFPTMAFPARQVVEPPPAQDRCHRPRGESVAENWANSGSEFGRNRPNQRSSMGNPGHEACWYNIQYRPCRCFPGGASGGPVWMAGGGGDCAHHLEQKKGLLVAVSASVDKIIAHFSTTRNIVQKAQLGDSRLSPEVGHLVLNTLCPALYALVGDGLKPFQKDVIAGRRRTSPWTVVEASAKPGPATRPLHALFCRICQLPQLSSSRKKFNAFIFGLLNAKLLDFWVSRLQENSGEHSTLYMQGGFLSLAAGSYQPLFEELLLIVQPLCILTFHLDLLFEYHHLQVNLRLLQPSAGNPPCQAPGPVATTGVKQHTRPSLQNSANGQCKQKGRKDAGDPVAKGRPEPETKVDSEPRRPALNQEPTSEQRSGYQAGGTLQYTFQQVLDWGGKLTQTLVGNEDCSPGPTKDPTRETCTKPTEERKGTGSDVKATTWWGQLSQASQVYRVPSRSSFPFATWSKLRPSAANNCPSAPTNHEAKKPEREYPVDKAPSESLCTKTDIQSVHQKRESEKEEISSCSSSDAPTNGVQGLRLQGSFAKGQNGNLESHEKVNSEPRLAESTQDETPLSVHGTPEFQDSSNQDSPLSQISPDFVTPEYQESFNQGTPGSQKSWYKGLLGFQDLVKKRNLDHELQDTLEKNSNGLTPPTSNPGALALAGQVLATRSGDADSPSSGRGVWLGHLFGAPCSTSRGSPTDGEAHPVRSRRPSSWLPPNMNVLGLVRKGVFVEKLSTYEETSNRPEDAEKQLRTVRAICDHASSAGTHLSFQKDEVLQILDTVDDDWIRCSRGGTTGLVPVAYTSLIL